MFEYKLKFRNTSAHANADALSCLPLPVELRHLGSWFADGSIRVHWPTEVVAVE